MIYSSTLAYGVIICARFSQDNVWFMNLKCNVKQAHSYYLGNVHGGDFTVMSIHMVVFVNSLMEKPQVQMPSLPKSTSMVVTCCNRRGPFLPMSDEELIPLQFKDTSIIRLYKKGNHQFCDNRKVGTSVAQPPDSPLGTGYRAYLSC